MGRRQCQHGCEREAETQSKRQINSEYKYPYSSMRTLNRCFIFSVTLSFIIFLLQLYCHFEVALDLNSILVLIQHLKFNTETKITLSNFNKKEHVFWSPFHLGVYNLTFPEFFSFLLFIWLPVTLTSRDTMKTHQ